MSNGDDPVLDPQAVLRSFSSKLRGYDSVEVDAHLRAIAGALRTAAQTADTGGAELEAARAQIMDNMPRRPFDAQQRVVQAVTRLLVNENEKSAVINAEMGTGKVRRIGA